MLEACNMGTTVEHYQFVYEYAHRYKYLHQTSPCVLVLGQSSVSYKEIAAIK